MKLRTRSGRIVLILATLLNIVLSTGAAQARNRAYQVIHKFQGGTDGWHPVGVPAVAKHGDLTAAVLSTEFTENSNWPQACDLNVKYPIPCPGVFPAPLML
jgi:hypothetical protein